MLDDTAHLERAVVMRQEAARAGDTQSFLTWRTRERVYRVRVEEGRRKERKRKKGPRNVEFEGKHPRGRGGQFSPKARVQPPLRGPSEAVMREVIREFLVGVGDEGQVRAAFNMPESARRSEVMIRLSRWAVERLRREYGGRDRVRVRNIFDPGVQRALLQTALIPTTLLRRIAPTVSIGPQPVTGWPETQRLQGVEARGHDGVPYDDVPALCLYGVGIFIRGSDTVMGPTLHEFGHALDHLDRLRDDPRMAEFHSQFGAGWGPYYTPGGHEHALEEFVAQAVGGYLLNGYQTWAEIQSPEFAAYLREVTGV